ncbi:hypothetical protein [Rhodococcus sp. Eu-32]|nr:hypothetical protein [Rhodococcus sp. Eu-32]
MAELLVDKNDGPVVPVDGGATSVTLGAFASDVVDAAGQFTGARR